MRILLVDDDSSVLQALIAVVKSMPGHDVRVAANAQKAHEHALAIGGVDLLITDVVMAPTDGITMRGDLQAHYPRMRAAFISGYDLSDYAEQMAGAAMLAKPVDADAVRAVIAAAEQALLAPPQPVAVPRAAVAAGPVAQPGPVAFVPVQTMPVAAPPQPRPVAAPQPAAVPRAVPQAVPVPVVRAVPQAVPAPTPVPQPRAVAAPQPVAVPVAVPQAVPAAVPRAVAQPQAVVTPPPAPVPRAVVEEEDAAPEADPLIGVQLGDYRVQKLLGKGVWGAVYTAIQLSVNRLVGLKVLDTSGTRDESAHSQFLADARAKAAVQHPFIISVFEADERNGLVFYTHEYLDGPTLEELIARGERFDEKTALQVMKAATEAMNYLWSHNFAHGSLDSSAIRFGSDNIPRLSNLAISTPDPGVSARREIQTLSGIISQLVPSGAQSPGLRALLGRMAGIQNPIIAWPLVLQAVKSLEPKVVPFEAAKIKAADAVASRAVEAARVTQKKAIVFQIVTITALVLVVGVLVWWFVISNARKLDAQVQIPAGGYPVGAEGLRADILAFEIDKYEVTIGEYSKFIDFCEADGNASEHKYDHPNAPKRISHVTEEVKLLIANAKIRGSSVFKDANNPGVPVDLNCPMVCVSWWDAYAYANWKGRDLPTQEEWEVAARGIDGKKYPWGNELKYGKFNSNQGYKPLERAANKTDDGYNYWAPVDEFSGDVSPFKVVGMAGNVAEWTYRFDGKKQFPVVKGGSFASDPVTMFERVEKIPAEDCWFVFPAKLKPKAGVLPQISGESERFYVDDVINANTRTLYIGFRTVKRK